MGELIFRTNHLNKVYKETHALNNFTINIKKGSIYALMGPNGAGKTTLIRIVTGVARKTSGDMTLFGKETEQEYNSVRNKIGTLIETPALYRDKTAYENLNINRMLKKIDDKKEIDRVLEIVDLSNTKNKKVKNFSLGMKQRLGIAKALLGNPEFLILDEPINGLDPFGIIEIRNLILDLNKNHGITMLIASHILKELTMVATHYCKSARYSRL